MGIEEALRRMAGDAGREACREAAEALGVGTAGCADAGEDECAECAARIAAAVVARMVPEGVEWPRFEDGEPVRIGDAVESLSGNVFEVECVEVYGDHAKLHAPFKGLFRVERGESVKRPEQPDTQAIIDEDAGKQPCEYFGRADVDCHADGGCPALNDKNCFTAKTRDLLRRQLELCRREDGGGR